MGDNLNERLNKEVRRHTEVVGTFPDHKAIIRLACAVPAEPHDEWAEGREHMDFDALEQDRLVSDTATDADAETSSGRR